MYHDKDKIIENINPILESNNCFLIDLKLGKSKHSTSLLLFVDKETNLTIDDCFNLSRQVEKSLLEAQLIDEYTMIEVSSPGADKPLKFLRQYPKHINRKFKLKYKTGDETKTEELYLMKIEENNLTFTNQKETKIINFNDIIEARIIISFK